MKVSIKTCQCGVCSQALPSAWQRAQKKVACTCIFVICVLFAFWVEVLMILATLSPGILSSWWLWVAVTAADTVTDTHTAGCTLGALDVICTTSMWVFVESSTKIMSVSPLLSLIMTLMRLLWGLAFSLQCRSTQGSARTWKEAEVGEATAMLD